MRTAWHVAVLASAIWLCGCDWISTATNAVTYHTIRGGEAGNVAALDSLVFVTAAESGAVIVHAPSGDTVGRVPVPEGTGSIDDLAIADGFVLVLDARPPGFLSVYSVSDPSRPRLAAGPRAVAVGPFSGVAARRGACVVSGGTKELTAWRYSESGALSGPIATTDLGRGQPDVLLGGDGRTLLVSTHYYGPRFGLNRVLLEPGQGALARLDSLPLPGAGFTAGGARPASFPIEAAELSPDTVLVAHAGGLALVRARAGERLALLGTVDVGGPAVNVDARDGRALVAVAGGSPALVVVEFGAAGPRIGRRIALPAGTHPAGVAFTATHAVVAARERGVLIFAL